MHTIRVLEKEVIIQTKNMRLSLSLGVWDLARSRKALLRRRTSPRRGRVGLDWDKLFVVCNSHIRSTSSRQVLRTIIDFINYRPVSWRTLFVHNYPSFCWNCYHRVKTKIICGVLFKVYSVLGLSDLKVICDQLFYYYTNIISTMNYFP